MNSLRRWLYRPKRSDPSLLAQFYFADEELNLIAAELDSFEGRKDPERCTALVNQLRACQARVLNVVSQMMDESVKEQRAPRDFRVKFPDDVIQENLAGQLWFGAECLAAGSSIMNREVESACMRPLARALTKNLDSLRTILREQCLRNVHEYTEQIRESLIIFDKLFAEFELSYVTAMVPVKTAHEYDMIQEITVLFSETVHRALKLGLLTRDMIDEYDPALMFTIPRLAIVSGVLIFKDGPLNPDNDPWNISEMFRPFQTLLLKIRELLGILTDEELNTLERALCSQEEPSFLISLEEDKKSWREERRKSREEKRQKGAGVKAKKKKDESDDGSIESELTAVEIAERLEALALSFEASRNAKQEQTEQVDPETQSKSSESSSSSSSLLSEGESEEVDGPNIVKGEVSDHLEDAQVQRFTNQLYYEANLDSHDFRQDVTLLGPLNAFTPGEIFTAPHSSLNADNSEPGDPTSGAAATLSDSHAQTSGCDADANFENSAAGRTHFAMNKCDSSDSGLHSEVLSNSGSMFTISSSDSNQILGMSDALVRSDSSPDRHSPSPPHHSCVQCDGDCKDDVTVNCGSKDVTLLDSRNSSSTLAPESESSCDDDKCLTSPPKDSDVASAGTISDEDDIMVSPLEENRRLIDAAETVTPHQTHCDKEATSKEAATTSPVTPNSEDLIAEKNAHTSPSDIQELNCLVSKGNVELEQEDQSQQGDQISESRGRVPENEIQHIESDLQDHSFAVNGDSESLSKKNIPLEDCQGDMCKPEDACDSSLQNDNMVNGSLPTETEVSETSASGLPQSNVIATLSFPDHAPISLPLAVEDGGNSDVISECSLIKEELEKDISESAPTDKEPPHTTLSNSRVSDTEPSLTVCSPPHSSPSATTTSQVTTSSPTAAAAASNTPCPPVSSSTNEAVQTQTSMPASTSSLSPSSSNERQSHSPSTHPPSRSLTAPSASAPATNHMDTKGPSSKSKGSSRKSSKATEIKGRRRGDPTSSSQRTSMPSQAKALMDSQLLDDCYHSSETSSYTSECGDQEEIALAIKAAESATRHQVRARFRSSSDMIHRLFVCISGVADQLQTNFAGDLRNILRAVFDINCSEPIDISEGDKVKDTTPLGAAYRAMSQASRSARRARHSSHQRQDPPLWIPDEQSNECMSCQVPFTFVRRRHHCRNCGKIYCSRCSSNFVPLPHFGQEKAVRVCNRCFMFRVTPFTVRPSS